MQKISSIFLKSLFFCKQLIVSCKHLSTFDWLFGLLRWVMLCRATREGKCWCIKVLEIKIEKKKQDLRLYRWPWGWCTYRSSCEWPSSERRRTCRRIDPWIPAAVGTGTTRSCNGPPGRQTCSCSRRPGMLKLITNFISWSEFNICLQSSSST